MSNLFFKASNFSSSRSLPQLSNVSPLVPDTEGTAYAHWIFNNSASSLVDAVSGKLLTLQGGATVQPTYSDAGVTLSTAYGNALQTDLVDSASQNLTLCAVVKCNVTALSILMGNLVASADVTSAGTGLFASSGKAYLTVKPTVTAAAATNGISSLTPTANITQTSNFFISASIDKATRKGIIFIKQADIESSNEGLYSATTYEQATKNIAIGNNAYTTSVATANTATFAEAIIFNRALSLSEMKAVASRSASRLANKGITF